MWEAKEDDTLRRSLVLLRLSPRTGTDPLCLISSLYQTGHCQAAQTKILICLKTVSVCWRLFSGRALHETVRYLICHISFPFLPKTLLHKPRRPRFRICTAFAELCKSSSSSRIPWTLLMCATCCRAAVLRKLGTLKQKEP